MKKMSILSTFLVLIFLVSSCASTVEVKKAPPSRFVEATISKGIIKGVIAKPSEATSTFFTEDPEVIAHVKFENISGRHNLNWEWYDPNGKLYYSPGNHPLRVSEGKYQPVATAWNKMFVRGEKAADLLGDWQVKVYLDNEHLTTKNFRIESDVEKLPPVAQKPNLKNWGFIVGIERYSNLPSVDFAQKDSSVMKEYFIRVLGIPEENIKYLVDSQATKSTITGHLRSILPRNVEKDSNLYLYFAGHGFPEVVEGKIVDTYLVPYDGNPQFITESGYKIKDLYEDLDKLKIQRTFVFLDACFSGGASRSEKMLGGTRPALIDPPTTLLKSDKVISLASTKGGQASNSYPERKHGLFTYFLLDGLKGAADKDGDGWISMEELFSYVRDNVAKVSRRKGVEQTPAVNPPLDTIKGLGSIKISRVSK
jgi:hypothetical protein